MENLPQYVGPVFIATTFLAVGFLIYAIRQIPGERLIAKIVLFSIAFWLVFQTVLGLGGFYQTLATVPPRVFAFGAAPTLLLIAALLIFARTTFIDPLSLKILTLLHIIRIPVELVLYWLAHANVIPQSMTFEGSNFDILSGITAPMVYFFAFRKGTVNGPLLIVWNIAALLLVLNVVINAILSFPGPLQRINFDTPNIAIMYFPFNLLPTVVVPIVIFAHLASLRQLLSKQEV
ncbi:MAG TPA: hypothetical protein VK612_08145 [Pyrinomonadaceae bacterium]|nr:hypothetical protein [Pyrinomonadaceae bacterium]